MSVGILYHRFAIGSACGLLHSGHLRASVAVFRSVEVCWLGHLSFGPSLVAICSGFHVCFACCGSCDSCDCKGQHWVVVFTSMFALYAQFVLTMFLSSLRLLRYFGKLAASLRWLVREMLQPLCYSPLRKSSEAALGQTPPDQVFRPACNHAALEL